jgi:hypothetical protein
MRQESFQRLVSLMSEKGVRHEAFELLADLRQEATSLRECLQTYVNEYTVWEESITSITGRLPNTGVHLKRAKELIHDYRICDSDQKPFRG